jgi:hypothetical protein
MIEDLLACIVQRCEELAIEVDDADAREMVALYRRLMDGSARAGELSNWLRAHHMLGLEPEPMPGVPAAEAEMPDNPLDWLNSLAKERQE